MRFGQLELGEPGAGAGTDEAAGGQRRMRLVDLKAVALVEQPDVDALLRHGIEEIGKDEAGDAGAREHPHDPHRKAGDEHEHEPGRGEDHRLPKVGLPHQQ